MEYLLAFDGVGERVALDRSRTDRRGLANPANVAGVNRPPASARALANLPPHRRIDRRGLLMPLDHRRQHLDRLLSWNEA